MRETGSVKFYKVDKKYGFINVEGARGRTFEGVFFHISDVDDGLELQTFDKVIFDIEMADKGPRARHIMLQKD